MACMCFDDIILGTPTFNLPGSRMYKLMFISRYCCRNVLCIFKCSGFCGFSETLPIPTELKIRSVTTRSDLQKNHARNQEVDHANDDDHAIVHEADHVIEDVHEAHHVTGIAHVTAAEVHHEIDIVHVTVVEARHVSGIGAKVEVEVVLVIVIAIVKIVIVTIVIVIVMIVIAIVTEKSRCVLKIRQRQLRN